MVARQKALADFGEFALRSDSLDEVLAEACRIVSEALGTDFAKILEIEPANDCAVVRAGAGWSPGVVGKERIPLSENSSEAFSIRAGQPVVANNIHDETRFEFATFLKDHGVVALVNVPIFLPGSQPYGILQVDSRTTREFGDEDTEFLRTYATILGPVIDRLHKSHSLRHALAVNRNLLQELQHRVKNHIGIIAAIVHARVRHAASDEIRDELTGIGDRIETVRLVHEQLYTVSTATSDLRISPFIERLVDNLRRLHGGGTGSLEITIDLDEVDLPADIAMPLGLIVNEFVVNSLKYAFDANGGVISIDLKRREDGKLQLFLADNGSGAGANRDLPRQPRGSGTGKQLIEGLAHQIGGTAAWSSAEPGTTLRIVFPHPA